MEAEGRGVSVRFSGQLDHVGTGGRNDTVDSSEREEDGVGVEDAVGMEDAFGVENSVGVKVVNLRLEGEGEGAGKIDDFVLSLAGGGVAARAEVVGDWRLEVAGGGVAVEGI